MKTTQQTINKHIWRLCEKCGDKLYSSVDKSNWIGITVSMGKCPICKKKAALIPVRDWEYASGNEIMWD